MRWGRADRLAGSVELVIARNPDPRVAVAVPVARAARYGLVFSTAGTWPCTKALYCYRLDLESWPDEPEIVERVGLRSCRCRAAAIGLILDRRDLGV